jgi:type IV pilus assembly protein PilY1
MEQTMQPNESSTQQRRILSKVTIACLGLFLASQIVAEPSQKPLFKKSGRNVAPNLFYTIDDSGSMGFNYAPVSLWSGGESNSIGPVIHRADTMAINANYYPCHLLTPDVTNTSTEAVLAMKLRSPQFNRIYYNPEILYQPWARGVPYTDPATGLFAPSNFVSALIDPRKAVNSNDAGATSGNVNLDDKYSFTPSNDFPICGGSTGGSPIYKSSSVTIFPATYYLYNQTTGKFTRYTLQSTYTPVPTFKKYPKRTDCTSVVGGEGVCTLANERQNFANWYTYYRTRSMLARGATSLAFSKIEQSVRVGYGQLNSGGATEAGVLNKTLKRGVRTFDVGSPTRTQFFSWLYTVPFANGTPLRRAMDDVGRYFSITSSTGPWANDPGTATGVDSDLIYKNMASCRRSYHVFMTDGYWNGASASAAINGSNIDNTTGPLIEKNENGRTYKYDPSFHNGITVSKSPYADIYSGTLADVAHYYWTRDLHPFLNNNVRVKMAASDKLVSEKPYYDAAAKIDRGDHAFWQHLTTYTVGLGITGTITDTTKVPPSVNWPRPVEDTQTAVDDLFHAAVNGRGRYLTAADPQEYQDAIEKTLTEIFSAEPANSGIALTSFAVNSKTKRFIPSFSQPDWIGDVTAYPMNSTTEIWSASSALPPAANRKIEVWNGTRTEAFNTSLSASVRSLMGDTSDNLIKFLRGDRSLEGAGGYRCRGDLPGTKTCTKAKDPVTGAFTNIGLFGDVVNSSPVFLGSNVDLNYQLLPDGEGKGYRDFVDTKKARAKNVVVVGANDGMLHVLDDATGKELYAFIPQGVTPFLKRLANRSYGATVTDNALDTTHHFFVDGKLHESDVKINGAWSNVLVGSAGGGAKSVFALRFDASNPQDLDTSPVLWEINALSSSTLQNKDRLGHINGSLATGRMKDGSWVAIFGNGMDSTAGGAYLWIVDIATGRPIRTPIQAGNDTSGNGLGPVTLVRDANRTIIAAYAGDAKGRLWRFDLDGSAPSSWKTGFGNLPLFTPSVPRPVTSAPIFVAHPKGGLMVMYATGSLYSDDDEINTDQQLIHGIWDVTVPGKPSDSATVASPSQLVEHSVNTTPVSGASSAVTGYTIAPSSRAITYTNASGTRGWFIRQRLAVGERGIFDPFILSNFAVFNTTAPSNSSAGDPCMAVSTRTFVYFLNPLTGKMAPYALFDTSGDGVVSTNDTPVGVIEIASDGGKVEPYKPCIGKDCSEETKSPCGTGATALGIMTNKATAAGCFASGYTIRTWQQLQNFPKKVKQ